MRRALRQLEVALDRARSGTVSPWPYALLRVALASVLLVRSTDLTRPVLDLEHHLWVRGLDFNWSVARTPYLESPAIPGFALAPMTNDALVILRTLLAVSLLFGFKPRFSAAALALASYALLLADRYRYFHHLHLLYVSIGWLAFCPLGDRLGFERGGRRRSPAWPLLLFRALVSGIYLSAGLAKLEPAYWSGQTLAELDRIGMLSGAGWEALRDTLGYAGLAQLSCLIELSLPVLLAFPRLRWVGIGLALGFHLAIGSALAVSTFGVTMVVLLLSYWPKSPSSESSPENASVLYNGRAG